MHCLRWLPFTGHSSTAGEIFPLCQDWLWFLSASGRVAERIARDVHMPIRANQALKKILRTFKPTKPQLKQLDAS